MLEDIRYFHSPNKILRDIKWEVKIGDLVLENSIICTLFLDEEESSLLSQILNKKIFISHKKVINSHISGIVFKINTKEEILSTQIIASLKTLDSNELFDCDHNMQYGTICVKCGVEIAEK